MDPLCIHEHVSKESVDCVFYVHVLRYIFRLYTYTLCEESYSLCLHVIVSDEALCLHVHVSKESFVYLRTR